MDWIALVNESAARARNLAIQLSSSDNSGSEREAALMALNDAILNIQNVASFVVLQGKADNGKSEQGTPVDPGVPGGVDHTRSQLVG